MNFKTVQKIVEWLTVIVLLIGIFWVVFGSIIYSKNKDISDTSDGNAFRGGFIFSIAFGAFLIFWCFIGLLAACKKINCLLSLYNVGMFFIVLISLAILGIAIAVTIKLPEYIDDKNCTDKSLLIDLKKLNADSSQLLCQPQCKCKFTSSIDQANKQHITTYSPTDGAIRVQDCTNFNSNTFDHINLGGLLRSIEETFNCSGFCSLNSYYVFSNVNDGVPEKDCKKELLNSLDDNIKRLLIASAIISFILLITLIFSCCLCFKRPKNGNYYERNGVGYNGNKN